MGQRTTSARICCNAVSRIAHEVIHSSARGSADIAYFLGSEVGFQLTGGNLSGAG